MVTFSDSLGYLHVVGEIKNNYPSTATFVTIVGTFYDINNQVAATDFTYANPSDIDKEVELNIVDILFDSDH